MAYRDALLDQLDPTRIKRPMAGPMEGFTAGGASPSPVSLDDPPEGIRAPGPLEDLPAPPAQTNAFRGKLEGFDAEKLGRGHDSPKYRFADVMDEFDPKGGISQEMLDALNKLGLGTVTGQLGGDKISIGGNVDPRFNGVTEFDIIRDLESGGGWQWGGLNGGPEPAPTSGGGSLPMTGFPPGLLQGDGQAQIAQGVEQYSQPSKYLAALLAQLGGQS